MKFSLMIVFATLTLTYCSKEAKLKNDFEFIESQEIQQEKGYPWTIEVTEVAVEAMHKSIENTSKPEKQRDKNFPADPYDMPFDLTDIEKLEIVGYSASTEQSDIYRISFQPMDDLKAGPNITVEINIKTKEPLRVYMTPDA